jgi:katanin p80 WD40 repeat-containing subunit B1
MSYLIFLVFSYHTEASVVAPSTPQRAGIGSNMKSIGNSAFASGGTTLKRSSLKSNNASNLHNLNKVDVVPVIVPRTSSGAELATESRSDSADVTSVLSKATRRVEPATDSKKENSDVESVIPRASSRVDSDSASAAASKADRRLESASDSKKESTDAAPVAVPRAASRMEMASDSAPVLSKASRRVQSATDLRKESSDVAPVIVPRTSSQMEMTSDSRREPTARRASPFRIQSRYAELRKLTHAKADAGSKNTDTDDFSYQIFLPRRNGAIQTINSEETREEVKHGAVDRMGFFNSGEPNTSLHSENCMMRNP